MSSRKEQLAALNARLGEAHVALLRAQRIAAVVALDVRELTVKQAATVLKCGEDGVRVLLREGILPGHPFGRQWRIPTTEFVEWLRHCPQPPDWKG
jgi:excisionase family DNA binding protein